MKCLKGVVFMSVPTKIEQKQIMTLAELSNRKVVEHNDLITSIAKMDKTPLKIFELAVSCIDTDNPPKDNIVYLSKADLFAFFKVSDNDKHRRFKESIEKMQKQAYFEVREKSGKGFQFESIVPIPYIKWTDYSDEVIIQFTPQIMPYLIELKRNFTQYALSDLVGLNSKYSIILYKWLSMYYNQYEHYNNKGGRTKYQIDKYRNPSISIQELRTMTDTVDEYKHFPHFEKWILSNPLEEITNYTHFNVTYEKIKKGRKIDSIIFHIEKKQVPKNELYKQEQLDPVYIQDKLQKVQIEKNIFAEAMQSTYTTLLGENWLISFSDTQNIKLMVSLQENVYPLYDELKELRGINGVKDHLSYVAKKQEGYSKRNIVKYLKTAIEQYLSTARMQKLKNE